MDLKYGKSWPLVDMFYCFSVDRDIVRGYFECTEGKPIKIFRIQPKIDTILRQFILSGGFDVEKNENLEAAIVQSVGKDNKGLFR